jgi:hypothetical protein
MSEHKATEPTATDFGELPIQPTGSGVADAEIARMQSELGDDAVVAPERGTPDEDNQSAPTKTQA